MFKKKVKILCLDPALFPEKHGNMWDLKSNENVVISSPELTLKPKSFSIFSYKLDLGIKMTMPKFYGARIYPRSSLYEKKGLMLVNSVGVIEWNYSDKISANLVNLSNQEATINVGERLLQMEIYVLQDAPWYIKLLDIFTKIELVEVNLIDTTRGGYGSSGGYV